MKRSAPKGGRGASQLISDYIDGLGDWRGACLARLRTLILQTAPGIAEEWKWGSPVWAHEGLVCSASAFKNHVKLNFFKGASLKDPKRLFNAGLDAKNTRAIDFNEGDRIDTPGLKNLIRSAVALNSSTARKA